MLRFSLVVLLVVLAGSDMSHGQAHVDLQKPSGLNVEIAGSGIFPFTLPVYQDGPLETSWSGDIPRTDMTPVGNSHKGLNIPFKISTEGDTVRVEIRIGLASFKEVAVASYLIRPDEKVVVQEVVAYGFAPFTLQVIRSEIKPPVVIPPLSVLPEIDNNLTSIKVVGLEKQESADLYLLSLVNTGTKDVFALEIIMPTGGIACEWGELDKPLIPSGAIYKANISAQQVGRIMDQGFEPDSVQPKGVISAALFDDGTYEGDYVSAATMEAWRRGRKIQLERVLTLVEKTLISQDRGSPITLETVKKRVYSLSVNGDATILEEISRHYPPLKAKLQYVAQGIKDAMSVEKYELISRLTTYEEQPHRAGGDDLREWLVTTRAYYWSLLNER